MATVIKKGDSKIVIHQALQKVQETVRKGFDAKKFNGILKFEEDPLETQRRMRDEWD